jgi:hypothetical protein
MLIVLIEFKKWMCYIDRQKNKYSVFIFVAQKFISSEDHPASYSMATGGSFTMCKVPKAGS